MSVLVVAAHPDDEVLGVGGAIARHVDAGQEVSILLLADGETSRGTQVPSGSIEERANAARAAASILGARPPRLLGFPDNRLDTVPLLDVVQAVEAEIALLKPRVIYTHHAADLNVDHRIACQAVLTACRPIPGSSVRAIYAFETPSATEWAQPGTGMAFMPRRYVDISSSLERKMKALKVYDTEMRAFPHARSYEGVKALACWRGSSAGLAAAEAFDILREIEGD